MDLVQEVTSPIFICDTFTERRLQGNPCAVCFCPSNVYSSSTSELCSLEASCGRGDPGCIGPVSREEREARDEKLAIQRDHLMGEAFQKLAGEMNLSETCFVYRLPPTRIKTVKELIRLKVSEFDAEQKEKRRKEEEAMESELLKASENDPQAFAEAAKNLFSGGLIPSASFLGCLENSMSMGSFSMHAKCTKRLNVQWFGLRWFTPNSESSMCGHGTLAAAHSLFETSRLASQLTTKKSVDHVPPEFYLPAKTDVICFVTELGIITVRKQEAESFHSYRKRDPIDPSHQVRDAYEMHFPSNEPISVLGHLPQRFVEDLLEALGLGGAPAGEDSVVVEDVAVAPRLHSFLVRLKHVRDVKRANPNELALREMFLTEEYQAAAKLCSTLLAPRGLIITAENCPEKGPAYGLREGERGADGEVISRVFEPWVGTLEDPVSGSAHTIIAPYWLRHRGQKKYSVGDKIVCYQASRRGGYVPCIIIGKEADRVALIGSCVTSMKGSSIYEVATD